MTTISDTAGDSWDDPWDVESDLTLYLAALHRGDKRAAVELAVEVLQRGVPAERVVTDLLSRAQADIGQGWQEGRVGVVTEHRASAITESALQAVVNHAMSAPGAVREGTLGRIAIACSEGEWHLLPGRMASEVLRLRGADVSFIGPSVPADELAAFLGDEPPTAFAITCSMPMSLVGAWRSISALRALGMTIVCGGRGFGPDGRWGIALGADHWAPSLAVGADILLSVAGNPARPAREPVGAPEILAEVHHLRRDQETLVEEAMQSALATWPSMHSDAAMRATRLDLGATLQVISAATLVDDQDLVVDYVTWFESVLTGHGLPLAYVPSAFDLLLGVLPRELARARAMATCGRDACSGPALSAELVP